MANRYWVGGTGTWDTASTANWAATSGGTPGASAPTNADNVFLDANSGTGVITCTGAVCADIDCSGYTTGSLFLSGSSVTCYGNVINSATVDIWATPLFLAGVGAFTIRSNGRSFYDVTLNSQGGAYTLADAFYSSTQLTIASGNFYSANYAMSPGDLYATGVGVSSLTLGSSTVQIGLRVSFSAGALFTFNAGTSTLTSSTITTFTVTTVNTANVSRVFYNVSSTSGSLSLAGTNTFNNVSTANSLFLGGNQTINGVLTLPPGTSTSRLTLAGGGGVQRVLTINSFAVYPVYYDFGDVQIAGAVAPISGSYFGNLGNTLGITFPAAKNVYWVGGSGNWNSATTWALTSGGSASINNLPLAQDTVVIDDNSGPASSSLGVVTTYVTTINALARTVSASLLFPASTAALRLLGDLKLSSVVPLSGPASGSANPSLQFVGRSAQILQTNGALIGVPVIIASIDSSVSLSNACTISLTTNYSFVVGALIMSRGTLSLNGYDLTVNSVSSNNGVYASGTSTKVIALGANNLSTNQGWTTASNTTGLTFTGTGKIRMTSSSAKTFAAGTFGFVYPIIEQAGAGTLTFTGSSRYAGLTNAYKATGATTVRFTGNTVSTFDTFDLAGESGRLCTLTSTLTSSRAGLALTSGAALDFGATSTDAGNNSGVTFSGAGTTGYLTVSYINGNVAQSNFLML